MMDYEIDRAMTVTVLRGSSDTRDVIRRLGAHILRGKIKVKFSVIPHHHVSPLSTYSMDAAQRAYIESHLP